MNGFEQHAQAPLSWQEHVEREENIARSEERHLLALDPAYEYDHELREFTGRRPPILAETGCTPGEVAAMPPRKRIPHMQGALDFEEVA